MLSNPTFSKSSDHHSRTCGVDLVRDDSGQDKLRVSNEAIQASSATADQKERARKPFAAYEATFAATQTPTADQDVAVARNYLTSLHGTCQIVKRKRGAHSGK